MTKTSSTSSRYDEVSFQRIERIIGQQRAWRRSAHDARDGDGLASDERNAWASSGARTSGQRFAPASRPSGRTSPPHRVPWPRLGLELVAYAADGHDVRRGGRIVLDLLPQPADVHVHRAGAAVVVVSPDM